MNHAAVKAGATAVLRLLTPRDAMYQHVSQWCSELPDGEPGYTDEDPLWELYGATLIASRANSVFTNFGWAAGVIRDILGRCEGASVAPVMADDDSESSGQD
jgi:hypothetical protein